MVHLLKLVLLLAFAACSATPRSDAEITAQIKRVREVLATRELLSGDPAVEAGLGAGFPNELDPASFRVGDRLLFCIDSFDVGGHERSYVALETVREPTQDKRRIELVQPGQDAPRRPLDTAFATVRVTQYDAQGRELERAESELARAVHELGLFAFVRAATAFPERSIRTLDSRRARLPLFMRDPDWAHGILRQLYDELFDNDALRGTVTGLHVWPDLLEITGLLFASLTLEGQIRRAKPVAQPIPELPLGEHALQFPVVLVHGRPLLEVRLDVVPPVGALAMTAGVVAAAGCRLADPERRFVMRLIGLAPGPK